MLFYIRLTHDDRLVKNIGNFLAKPSLNPEIKEVSGKHCDDDSGQGGSDAECDDDSFSELGYSLFAAFSK